MSFRLDYGRLDAAARTPSGGLKIPAFVTRVGVFSYKTDQGVIVRELRHPDHVFSKESLDSMEDAPLTVRHPGKVTPSDYKSNAAGHVRNVEASGKFVAARAIVQDAAAIKGVESGDLVEVSCGYSCDIVPTSGVYEGEKYDTIQTNIRYNHVALGPRGWGRAGSSVALRLDSGDAIQETPTSTDVIVPPQETPAMLVTIAGKPYTVGTPEHIQALTDFAATETKRADAAEAAVTTEKSATATAQGRADAAEAAVKTATDPAVITTKVNARLALQATASKVLGAEFKFDGKSDHEIMVAAIVKADPEFKADGKDAGYILGRFEYCQPRQDAVGQVRAAAKIAQLPADAPKTMEQRRADAREAAENAWKQPLSLSKK